MRGGVTAGHEISYNRFSRPETILDADGEPANEQETIRVGDSAHSMQKGGCVVKGNYFYRGNGEAQEIVSNKCYGNTYSGNVFYESKGTLTQRQGNGCTVSGNYFPGNDIADTGGVRIIGEDHVVEENWFERLNSVGYKAALCLVRGEENVSLGGYAQVKNALVKGNTSNYVVRYEDSDPQAEITWSNNRFYGLFKNNRFDLTALKVRPDVGNAAAEMDAIEQAAGTSRE